MRTKSINFPNTADELEALFDKLQRGLTNYALNAAGLSIEDTGEPMPETDNTVLYLIDGTLHRLSAQELVPPSGTVTNAKFNVFVYTFDDAGVDKVYMGTEGATLASVVFPEIPEDEAIIGFIVINPTGTGNFVGGTTDLDDATVTPNAVYVDTPYPFLPELKTL